MTQETMGGARSTSMQPRVLSGAVHLTATETTTVAQSATVLCVDDV